MTQSCVNSYIVLELYPCRLVQLLFAAVRWSCTGPLKRFTEQIRGMKKARPNPSPIWIFLDACVLQKLLRNAAPLACTPARLHVHNFNLISIFELVS